MAVSLDDAIDLSLMDDVFEEFEGQEEALIPVLEKAQALYGSLSLPIYQHVAKRLGIPVNKVYSAATFYALFTTKPEPEPIIRVCRDGACALHGADAVYEAGREALGERVVSYSCLGHCHAGPVAMVDDFIVTHLTPESWTGEWPPEADLSPVPILTPEPERRLLARIGQIDPESLAHARAAGAYAGLGRALKDFSPQQVIDEVIDSGLQGRGGAGFPTGRKWAFTAAAQGEPKYIICNADESEPGTFKDRALMEGDPHRVIEGMILAGYAVGAAHGVIYIRGEYTVAYHRLETALAQARAANLLGDHILGSDFSFDIELHRGHGAYICGEETALIESLEGKPGKPRIRPPYPPTYGLWGKPTVVNNVETLANVPDIINLGAEAYQKAETKLYCLSGHVATSGLVEARLGLTLRQAIEAAGGMAAGRAFHFALTGGAAGTFVGPEALDIPLTFTSARTDGVSLGSGALLVADDSVRLIDMMHNVMAFFARESCGHCFPCRHGTLRSAETLERLAHDQGESGDIAYLQGLAQNLAVASFCGLGQGAAIPLRSGLTMLDKM